jgi:hypothetical protein
LQSGGVATALLNYVLVCVAGSGATGTGVAGTVGGASGSTIGATAGAAAAGTADEAAVGVGSV